MKKLFTHPQEVWDEKKCAQVAKHRGRDGCGALHPYPGRVAGVSSPYPEYGQTQRYNGGREINGEYYQAEHKPLPKIPDTYEFFTISSWGTYLRKKA
jgi:hypothetical protein